MNRCWLSVMIVFMTLSVRAEPMFVPHDTACGQASESCDSSIREEEEATPGARAEYDEVLERCVKSQISETKGGLSKERLTKLDAVKSSCHDSLAAVLSTFPEEIRFLIESQIDAATMALIDESKKKDGQG